MLATALRGDGWTLRRDVVWDKGSATEPPRADRPAGSHEMVFLLSQGVRYRFDATGLPHGSVWRVQPQGIEGHGAAFPPDLIEPMVRAGSKPGDTILDPFAGSGTTLEVAVRAGRLGLGIELNPEYGCVAEKRLAEPLGVGGLFHRDTPVVTTMFDDVE
jgi:site-specific DNA-methyltransferase (cytosine-N4-specific)